MKKSLRLRVNCTHKDEGITFINKTNYSLTVLETLFFS